MSGSFLTHDHPVDEQCQGLLEKSFSILHLIDSTRPYLALVSLILGGIGNVGGALLGGIIIGLIESVASFYIGMGWAQAVLFIVFLLTLTLRPYGLFGKNIEKA